MIELFKITGLSDLTIAATNFSVEHCRSGATFDIAYGCIDDSMNRSEQNIFNLEHADTFIATNATLGHSDALLIAEAAYFLRSSHNTDLDEDDAEYSGKRLQAVTIGFASNDDGLLQIKYTY